MKALDLLYGLILTGLFIVLVSCAYVKPACQVVDLTDDACHEFVLERPDGAKEHVKMSRLQAQAFVRTGAVPADAGCK